MSYNRKELKEYAARIQNEFAEVPFDVTKRRGVWELTPTAPAFESYIVTLGKKSLIFTITTEENTKAISAIFCHNIEEVICAIKTFYKHGAKLHDEIDSRCEYVLSEIRYKPYSLTNEEDFITAKWGWGDIEITLNVLQEIYILSVIDKRQETPLEFILHVPDVNHVINVVNFFNEFAEVRNTISGTDI